MADPPAEHSAKRHTAPGAESSEECSKMGASKRGDRARRNRQKDVSREQPDFQDR